MEGVKRTSTVMVYSNQQAGLVSCNLYAMNINQGNRNCYNYRRFEHLTRNCRNTGTRDRIKKGRRLEYKENKERKMIENKQNNLNGNRDLIVFNQISVTISLQCSLK